VSRPISYNLRDPSIVGERLLARGFVGLTHLQTEFVLGYAA
jgi:hypothetical protein